MDIPATRRRVEEHLMTHEHALNPREHAAPQGLRDILGTLGAVVLGAVLLFAAYAKVIDPMRFEETIRLEGLDFFLSAHYVALIAIALEVFLGVALLLGVRHKAIVIPSILLVAFFIYLTAHAWYAVETGARSPEENCGCFGNLVERTPKEAFFMDLLMLVPPLLLLVWGMRGGALPRGRLWVATALAVALTAFAFKAPDLPLDDLATRLHRGDKVSGVCAGEGLERSCLTTVQVGLDRGHWIVVMADLEDRASIEEHFPAWNDYANATRGTDRPKLVVMTPIKEEDVKVILAEFSPSFFLRHAPLGLIRPLYRRLPRTMRIENDSVVELWDGMPSFEDGGAANKGWGTGDSKGGTEYGDTDTTRPARDEQPAYGEQPEYGDEPKKDGPAKDAPPKNEPVVPKYGD